MVIIQLREILEATARDIRYLLSEEICVPDDEDNECIQPDDYCNIPTIPVVEVDYSGSGEPPTIVFGKPDVEVNVTTTTTTTTTTVSPTKSSFTTYATVSKSQVVPYETNTPSGPNGPTLPPEWNQPTTDPDDQVDEDAGASSIHQSLCLLLLLTATVVFLW